MVPIFYQEYTQFGRYFPSKTLFVMYPVVHPLDTTLSC